MLFFTESRDALRLQDSRGNALPTKERQTLIAAKEEEFVLLDWPPSTPPNCFNCVALMYIPPGPGSADSFTHSVL